MVTGMMIAAWTLAGWMSDLSNTSSFLSKRAHRRECRTSKIRPLCWLVLLFCHAQSEAPVFRGARAVLLMLLFLPTINLGNKGFKLGQTVRPTRVLAYALAALLSVVLPLKMSHNNREMCSGTFGPGAVRVPHSGGLGRRVRVETVWGNKPSVCLP